MSNELVKAIGEILDTKLEQILDTKLEQIQQKLDETYNLVKALEYIAQVHKSEYDKMANDIVHMKDDVIAIKKNITNVEVAVAVAK